MSEELKLILDPTNPLDFDPAELDDLAAELRADPETVEVTVHLRDEHGYGGPLPVVLVVWVAAGGVASATLAIWALAEKVGKVLQGQFKQEAEACEPDEKPRERSVSFVDLDGNPLVTVRVKAPEGEVERTDDANPPGRPFPGTNERPPSRPGYEGPDRTGGSDDDSPG
jgi:hypothetical protein